MSDTFQVSIKDEYDENRWKVLLKDSKKIYFLYKNEAPRKAAIGDELTVKIKKIVKANQLYKNLNKTFIYVTTKGLEVKTKIDWTQREFFDVKLLSFNHYGWKAIDSEHNPMFMPATHSFDSEFNNEMVGKTIGVKLLKAKEGQDVCVSHLNTLSREITEINVTVIRFDEEYLYLKGSDLKLYTVKYVHKMKPFIDIGFNLNVNRYPVKNVSFRIDHNLFLYELTKNKYQIIYQDEQLVEAWIKNVTKEFLFLRLKDTGIMIKIKKPEKEYRFDSSVTCQYHLGSNSWNLIEE